MYRPVRSRPIWPYGRALGSSPSVMPQLVAGGGGMFLLGLGLVAWIAKRTADMQASSRRRRRWG